MPKDPTPHGGEAMHPLPDRARIPTGDSDGPATSANMEERPPLPEATREMPADRSGSGGAGSPSRNLDDDKPSVVQQPA